MVKGINDYWLAQNRAPGACVNLGGESDAR